MEEKTTEQVKNRTAEGKFVKGVSGNPGGRPKGSMKSFMANEFLAMSDKDKRQWLIDNKVAGIDQLKMAEGNPANHTDLTTQGDKIQPLLVKIIGEDEQGDGDTEGV